uniref:Uncharacterized protein n=1 Tax=Cyanistes caeruleus TaxID=156563 RepID=A0A8C0VHM6_CYACU
TKSQISHMLQRNPIKTVVQVWLSMQRCSETERIAVSRPTPPQACIPVLHWLPIPGTPEAMLHTCPILAPEWPDDQKSQLGEGSRKAVGYLSQDMQIACSDPASWNFYQLNTAATRSGSSYLLFSGPFCLSAFLLLIPSSHSFE